MKVKTVSYAKLVSFERFNNHRAEVVIEVEEGDIAQEVLDTAKALVDQALKVEEETADDRLCAPDVWVKEENIPTGDEMCQQQEDEDLEIEDDADSEAL